MRQARDRSGPARLFSEMFGNSSSADALFERSLVQTNKFSLWIQLVVGFGFAVLFLHYCCVEAMEQERFSFLFWTFWTCVAVVTLQITALFCAMSVIAFSFMMIYVHRIGSLPLRIATGALLSWCNVALFIAMVLTARSANLTSYRPSRGVTLGSFFSELLRRDPGAARSDAGRSDRAAETSKR